jgi:hypothetical protein
MGDLWYETSMGNGPKRIAHVGTGPEAIQDTEGALQGNVG